MRPLSLHLAALLAATLCSGVLYAHGGRMDAEGCHVDPGNGQFHCHRAFVPEPALTSAEPPACGAKRYCGEMESCAEARFYLERCGVTRLDGDRDGVPCERICRK